MFDQPWRELYVAAVLAVVTFVVELALLHVVQQPV